MKKRLFSLSGVLLVLAAGLFYIGSGKHNAAANSGLSEAGESPAPGKPDRAALLDDLWSERRILLVYPADDPDGHYQEYASQVRQRSRGVAIHAIADTAITPDSLAANHLIVLGSPGRNTVLRKMLPELPAVVANGAIELFSRRYAGSGDVLSLLYPNPENPNKLLSVLTGQNDKAILESARRMGRLFSGSSDYQILRNGQAIVMGNFSQDPQHPWTFDKAQHRDFLSETRTKSVGEHYRFSFHRVEADDDSLERWALGMEKRLAQLLPQMPISFPEKPIEYHLYPSCEDKGLKTGSTDLSHADHRNRAIHSVVESARFRGDHLAEDVRLLVRMAFGKPRIAMLETGVSIHYSSNWHGKGYDYWAARLHHMEPIPLSELLDNALMERESGLVYGALAASLVAWLKEEKGDDFFWGNYKTWDPAKPEVKKLEAGWHRYLDGLYQRLAGQVAEDRKSFPKVVGFQKGFCHAHEGYQIHNGYISRKSDMALEKLAGLGGTAVSITPFSYMRSPHVPVFLRHSRRAGSENDESVIHAALTADRLGMSVMMKPHIWLGRSWPGEIEMKSDEEWQQFFQYYYRWIRHFALIAEMYEMELLTMGVELCKATVGHEAVWLDMVKKIRRIYSGAITYSPNWGEEFEALAFWDAFDYIGLNSYYPLHDGEEASVKDLKKGVAAVIERIEKIQARHQRPVLLTEIGFTSTMKPWLHPHETARGKELNLEHQRRCYEAVFSMLYEEEWLAGIYWWKWPSYLSYGGQSDPDFTPNGKPAQDVVEKWFGKQWQYGALQ